MRLWDGRNLRSIPRASLADSVSVANEILKPVEHGPVVHVVLVWGWPMRQEFHDADTAAKSERSPERQKLRNGGLRQIQTESLPVHFL